MKIDENGNVHVSWSTLKDADKCYAIAHYKHIRRLTPDRNPVYFLIGNAIHEGMHAGLIEWAKDGDMTATVGTAVMTARAVLDTQADEDGDEDYQADVADARHWLGYFFEFYLPRIGLGERFEVRDTSLLEKQFSCELPSGDVLYGTPDAVLWDNRYGGWAVIDWKSRKYNSYLDNYLLDQQLKIYAAALREQGYDVVSTVMVNMCKTTPQPARVLKSGKLSKASNQKTTEEYWLKTVPEGMTDEQIEAARSSIDFNDPLDFLMFAETYITEEICERAMANVQSKIVAWKAVNEHGTIPKVLNSKACAYCDYQKICLAEESGDDTSYIIETEYRKTEDRY